MIQVVGAVATHWRLAQHGDRHGRLAAGAVLHRARRHGTATAAGAILLPELSASVLEPNLNASLRELDASGQFLPIVCFGRLS